METVAITEAVGLIGFFLCLSLLKSCKKKRFDWFSVNLGKWFSGEDLLNGCQLWVCVYDGWKEHLREPVICLAKITNNAIWSLDKSLA